MSSFIDECKKKGRYAYKISLEEINKMHRTAYTSLISLSENMRADTLPWHIYIYIYIYIYHYQNIYG